MASITAIALLLNSILDDYPTFGRDMEPSDIQRMAQSWARALADVPDDLLPHALVQHERTPIEGRYVPGVGQIYSAAAALMEAASPTPTAEEAWGEANRYRNYRHAPQFSHPLIDRAVAAIGWAHIFTGDTEAANRKHFYDTFNALSEKERAARRALPAAIDTARRIAAGQDRPRLASGA